MAMKPIPNKTESILVGPTRELKTIPISKAFEGIASSRFSNNIAIIFEENGITRKHSYSEVDALTNSLARCLHNIILDNKLSQNGDGDYVIAVSMDPSDYLIIILLAILKTGAAYLPLDSSFPQHRVKHILQEGKPTMVICDKDDGNFDNTFRIISSDLLRNCNSFLPTPLDNQECPTKSKDEIAIIMYTSGSTGVPKGIRLTHRSIMNRFQWQYEAFPYSKTETNVVFKTALIFGDSIAEIWSPLLKGLTVVVAPKGTTQNPEKLVNLLEKYKIERLVLVPSLLKAILMYFQIQNTTRHLPLLKTWVCSGENLLKSLVIEFFNYFPSNEYRLCNFYGSSEVTADVTYYVISNLEQLDKYDKIPIGLPIHNTIIYLLDSNFHPVEVGNVGELFVAGLNLGVGYVNGRDSEKFIKNPLREDLVYSKLFRTGDFARIANNTLIYQGRTDSQIKVHGHRMDIVEIENAINAIDGVVKSVVLCYKLNEPNQALLAFVTTNTEISEHHIEISLRKIFPIYLVPEVTLIEDIPLLVTGKVDRRLLLDTYETSTTASDGQPSCEHKFDFTGVSEFKMATARILFETIASIINRSKISLSINTNFYDVGGTSLNSIATITALKDKGYFISIENFVTARDLGEMLSGLKTDFGDFSNVAAAIQLYSIEVLSEKYKRNVIEMICDGFSKKSIWALWTEESAAERQFLNMWRMLTIAKYSKLSFIVKSNGSDVVGVSINFDARDEPEHRDEPTLAAIYELIEKVETPLLDSLPQEKGKVMHSVLMATDSSLSPEENVAVIYYMEEQVLQIAKNLNFEQVITTNTSPLTQQLASDVFLYETIADVQINKYIANDGTKPFYVAPDSWTIVVQRKSVK